jgi:hypothetical protein
MKYLILCSVPLLLSVTACQKEKEETKRDILLRHTWITDKRYTNGVEQTLDSCLRDDTYKFDSENHLVVGENSTPCWGRSYDNPYLYVLSADQKILKIANSTGVVPYDVLSITHERLEIQYGYYDASGPVSIFKETYKAVD